MWKRVRTTPEKANAMVRQLNKAGYARLKQIEDTALTKPSAFFPKAPGVTTPKTPAYGSELQPDAIAIANDLKTGAITKEQATKMAKELVQKQNLEVKTGAINPNHPKPIIEPIRDFVPTEYETFGSMRGSKIADQKHIDHWKSEIEAGNPIPPAIGIKHVDVAGKVWFEPKNTPCSRGACLCF